MTEHEPKDETRRRFEQLLEAKKAKRGEATHADDQRRGPSGRLPQAKGGRTFRRKV